MEPVWESLPIKLLSFNPDYGGITALLTGIMGSGKTTLLAYIAEARREQGELIIWRGLHSGQAWLYLPELVFHVKRSWELRVARAVREYGIDVLEFVKVPKLLPDVTNVVYAPPEWWRKYLVFLTKRQPDVPLFVAVDEFEDICPSYAASDVWHEIRRVSFALKEARKAWVNLFAATQSVFDIDYRVRDKFVVHVYLPGARVPSGHRVRQEEVDRLMLGEAIIEWSRSLFKKITFPPLRPIRERRIFILRRARTPSPHNIIQ